MQYNFGVFTMRRPPFLLVQLAMLAVLAAFPPEVGAVEVRATTASPVPRAAGARTVSDLFERAREIRFESGGAKLLEASLPFLEELAVALSSEPATRLEIVVHTADNGDAKKDLALSKRRAEAVKRALVDKGAKGEQLVATGRGSEDPVAPNLTRTGRFRNERVELHRVAGAAR